MIHSSSDVQTKSIGVNTQIWQYCVVLPGAIIGDECNINAHVFIENDVIVGNRVTIKSGVQLWDGIHIEDDVFIGPNVTFTNDNNPRSKQYPKSFEKTIIRKGASVGANCTLLSNIEIGENALIGAGSVVTKNVLPQEMVVGNPAKRMGWVNKKGARLLSIADNTFKDIETGEIYDATENGLILR